MDVVKRPRISRRQRALETRLRLARAATDLFAATGYSATTMEAVAKRAGVAVQTVYFVFHTKPRLLVEAVRIAGGGDEGASDVMARSWIQEVIAAPDGARRLALAIEHGSLIYQRIGPLWPTVAAALGEPEVREAWERIVEGRRNGMRRIIELMASRHELRAGLDPELATDVLFGLHRHELYIAFTTEAGWTFDRWRAWTYATLCLQLLPPTVAAAAIRPGSPATADLGLGKALPEIAGLVDIVE